ncbi:MAG: UDP-galactopyranose mutase [Ignavibacteriaceae bacterium]|jgi:UDP-galactopyranose mutase|nr:MAG: UDP-galactopyranose mutase [Chlorobiota bacterium]KXK03855.1 MAG: UDP-galactopyranose mutase [Chlorobi bacterium OLB4]MBV6398218.1 UDP-galactopyranose mutase [Ignavibacteria bacterium]MCC6885868.1 UDP-galactopyranose mutase [Ignavibacteriales bacterium]MCE7953474.1 UDP-galactopyranose mutase [Chlorobi bacterium CHB7]MDL1887410.1 UDP-galactopyranose mutase [Ignavibacteria bacterium CHB1]MEB2330027.1 UDP-galactopyranose mutase [Ignavibacteriaceae bacterium]OQY78735.1 MAG: UDP-galactopy
MKFDYLIVGAGFAGAVMAERLASVLNKKVLVIDKRNHIAGNAFDERNEYDIMIHKYGPHLFHTNSEMVFSYLSMFTDWYKYEHRVLAFSDGELYQIPINKNTLNKVFNLSLATDREVSDFLDAIREKRYPILNSEDVIVNQVGSTLFEKFFKSYTLKQWQREPKELSASVCGRIPVRTNEDDRYFTDRFQYMPSDGYTKMFERILSHENITVELNKDFFELESDLKFDNLIYTGPIDKFYGYRFGKLPYRSLRFEYKSYEKEFYQPVSQVNYVDPDVDFTRVVEYKHITNPKSKYTTIACEFSQSDGEPFYPVPSDDTRHLYMKYRDIALKERRVKFCGRLAEYQYFNMDQVVANTLKVFKQIANE